MGVKDVATFLDVVIGAPLISKLYVPNERLPTTSSLGTSLFFYPFLRENLSFFFDIVEEGTVSAAT